MQLKNTGCQAAEMQTNVSSASIFHKIIKKFSLHNKYVMQAVN